jgi:hypothetical protein
MATQTRKLEPDTWRPYLDWISRHFSVRTEVEVDRSDVGDQILANPLVIDGLSYDPQNREVVVTATDAQFEHHISEPREIYVVEELGQPSVIEILDGEGYKQIVYVAQLAELPPPPPEG